MAADVDPARAPQASSSESGLAASPATVILTRPAGRNDVLAQQLNAHGVPCLILPALALTPMTTPAPLPQGFDLIVFVSGFAAQCYFRARCEAWPVGVLAAGVGSATRQAILACGRVPHRAAICPPPASRQDSEALWQTLQAAGVRPRRVLIVRGDTGRDWLRQQWQAAGVDVQEFVAYRRSAAVWSPGQGRALAACAQSPCVLLVTSADSVRAIAQNLQRLQLTRVWGQCRILTVHARIAESVARIIQQALGVAAQHPVTITTPDAHAVLQSLLVLAKVQ